MQNKMLQSGRSMVEMLGTLAIIGVLSVGGIAGYSYGMDKYQANTIVNDVMLRAVELKAQLDTTEAPNLDSWPTTTAGKYAIGLETGGEYINGIQVSGVDKRLCEMLFDGMINNAIVKIGSTEYDSVADTADCSDTNTMVFYVDNGGSWIEETETDTQTDTETETTETEETDTQTETQTETKSETTETEETDTQTETETTTKGPCTSDSDCTDETYPFCSNGICVACTQDSHCPTEDKPYCANNTCVECISYDDCGTNQYCHYMAYDCNPRLGGYCKNLSFSNYTITYTDTSGKNKTETFHVSNTTMTWWDAVSACEAMGKSLIGVSDLATESGGGAWQGDYGIHTRTDLAEKLYSASGETTAWTKDVLNNTCLTCLVEMDRGYVGHNHRSVPRSVICR